MDPDKSADLPPMAVLMDEVVEHCKRIAACVARVDDGAIRRQVADFARHTMDRMLRRKSIDDLLSDAFKPVPLALIETVVWSIKESGEDPK